MPKVSGIVIFAMYNTWPQSLVSEKAILFCCVFVGQEFGKGLAGLRQQAAAKAERYGKEAGLTSAVRD